MVHVRTENFSVHNVEDSDFLDFIEIEHRNLPLGLVYDFFFLGFGAPCTAEDLYKTNKSDTYLFD